MPLVAPGTAGCQAQALRRSWRYALQRWCSDGGSRDGALVRRAARSGCAARSRARTGSLPNCSARSTGSARALRIRPVSPAQAAELLGLVADGTISGTIAKQVFEIMLETGEGAADIVEKRGPQADHPTPARSTPRSTRSSPPTPTRSPNIRAASRRLFGFFVGQTMKAMQGKANPQVVNERLRAKLD